MAPLSSADAAAVRRRITALSVVVAGVLMAVKAAAWLQSGSVAVLASLADSSLDLAASLFTFFAVRYAAAPPDAEHRFGHGKAEAFASLVQAGLVFASAALVAREGIGRLLDPEPLRAEAWALGVMVISIILTAGLVSAQSAALRQAGSLAVSGDRLHYLADLASNAVAIAGLAVVWATGWSLVDAAAGLLIAAWLVHGAVGVLRASADQLMDHELPAAERAQVLRVAGDDPRIVGVHELRTRMAGPTLHMQMHMDLDPDLTLREAHEIVEAAEARLRAAWPDADVLIHPDPDGFAEIHEPLAEPVR
jgi:ferrous-iron efflux pump FieF